jgi:hypothetical protein
VTGAGGGASVTATRVAACAAMRSWFFFDEIQKSFAIEAATLPFAATAMFDQPRNAMHALVPRPMKSLFMVMSFPCG